MDSDLVVEMNDLLVIIGKQTVRLEIQAQQLKDLNRHVEAIKAQITSDKQE